jgi:hypothetical protein
MAGRVISPVAATEVMLRLAPGTPVPAVAQNDGGHPGLAQALRCTLCGAGRPRRADLA